MVLPKDHCLSMALQSTIFAGPFFQALLLGGEGEKSWNIGHWGGYPLDSQWGRYFQLESSEMSCAWADDVYPPVFPPENGWLNLLGGVGFFFDPDATWIMFFKVMFFYGLYHGKTPLKHHLREYTFSFSKHLKQSQGYIFFFLPILWGRWTHLETGAYIFWDVGWRQWTVMIF